MTVFIMWKYYFGKTKQFNNCKAEQAHNFGKIANGILEEFIIISFFPETYMDQRDDLMIHDSNYILFSYPVIPVEPLSLPQ